MIPYKTIFIAAAIGVMPIFAWLWLLRKYQKIHSLSPGFLLKVLFFGVLTAVPASILEIAIAETGSNNQILLAMQDIWSYGGVAVILPSSISSIVLALLPALTSSFIVAFIEEFSKGMVIFWSVHTDKFKLHNDGLVFGVMIGLAFAVTENGVYFANSISSQAFTDISSVVLLRYLLSTSAHIIYSGILGKYLADAVLAKNLSAKIVSYGKAFVIPVLIHTLFNFLLSTPFGQLVELIILGGMLLLGYFYWQNRMEGTGVAEKNNWVSSGNAGN